jgi:hypothetical protein
MATGTPPVRLRQQQPAVPRLINLAEILGDIGYEGRGVRIACGPDVGAALSGIDVTLAEGCISLRKTDWTRLSANNTADLRRDFARDVRAAAVSDIAFPVSLYIARFALGETREEWRYRSRSRTGVGKCGK